MGIFGRRRDGVAVLGWCLTAVICSLADETPRGSRLRRHSLKEIPSSLPPGPGMAPHSEVILEPADADEEEDLDGNYTENSGTDDKIKPYIRLSEYLRNSTQDSSSVLKLKCEVLGTLPITFEWFKDEAPLRKEKGRIVVKNHDYFSRLRINSLRVLDAGYYRCEASNKGGKVNTTAVIKVRNADLTQQQRGGFRVPDHSIIDRANQGPACITYEGFACKSHLAGFKTFVQSYSDPESIMDIERTVRAALSVINNSSDISPACKELATKMACFHNFPPCDTNSPKKPSPVLLCQADCDQVEKNICKKEYQLAKADDLIGDGKLLPNCKPLPTSNCIPVMEGNNQNEPNPTHWCYHGTGKFYRGTSQVTESGFKCKQWGISDLLPTSDYPELRNHNFCRNPGGLKTKPWCFTNDPSMHEEYCRIDPCPQDVYPDMKQQEGVTYERPTPAGPDPKLDFLWGMSRNQVLLIGGAVVGLFVLALIGVMMYCCMRRKNRKLAANANVNGNGKLSGKGYGGYQHGSNGDAKGFMTSSVAPGVAMNGYPNGAMMNGKRHPYGNDTQQVEMMPFLSQSPAGSEMLPDIPLSNIRFLSELGEGQFGKVWRGELIGYNTDEEPLQVAIKTLKDDAMPRQRSDFQHEAELMNKLRHPNIIELVGVCFSSSPHCLVFEYMMHGDLHEFLLLRSPYSEPSDELKNEQMMLDQSDFLNISLQIAAGMEYLASHHYVHRDLAARNCLVTDRLIIKIADFGLSRDIYSCDYYRIQSKTFLPVRWMPAEAIMHGKFGEESDVWSYGVTLWELYSYGTQPYFGCSNEEVIELIRTRCLLECPENCPSRMYSLMVECWHEDPSRRPKFAEIHGRLQTWSMMSSPAHSSALTGGVLYQSAGAPPPTRSTGGSTHSGSCHSSRNSNGTGPANSNQTATTQLSGLNGGFSSTHLVGKGVRNSPMYRGSPAGQTFQLSSAAGNGETPVSGAQSASNITPNQTGLTWASYQPGGGMKLNNPTANGGSPLPGRPQKSLATQQQPHGSNGLTTAPGGHFFTPNASYIQATTAGYGSSASGNNSSFDSSLN